MKAYSEFADIYDELMSDVDYGAWAEYLASLIGGAKTVADCACGTGEITVRLADAGFELTGVDISADMLARAADKARKRGKRIPFVCQDISELALMRPVDAIVCACDGVNYLTSEGAASFFKRAAAGLKPRGKLLFDISSEYKLRNVIGSGTIAEDDGELAFIWTNELTETSVEMELSFFVKQGELFRRFTEEHVQYIYTVPRLLRLLDEAGFDIIGTYEAFTFDAPTETSERIQFAAVRRGE